MTFLLVLLVLTFPVLSSADKYKVLREIDGDTSLKSKWGQNRSRTDKSSTTGRHNTGVSIAKDIECIGDNGWVHNLKLGCPWGWKEKTAYTQAHVSQGSTTSPKSSHRSLR